MDRLGSVTSMRTRSFSSVMSSRSFSRSTSKRDRCALAVDLEGADVAAPPCTREASSVPMAPPANSTRRRTHRRRRRARHRGWRIRTSWWRGNGDRLADQVAREVDDVRAEVGHGTDARLRAVEAPGASLVRPQGGRRREARAEVDEVPELACLDQLPRQANCRQEPQVEAAHVDNPCARASSRRRRASAALRPSGFSQSTCLPFLAAAAVGSRCSVVRSGVVEDVDSPVRDLLGPVRAAALPAELTADAFHGVVVSAADRDQARHRRGALLDVCERAERPRVGLAHEAVAQQRDAEFVTSCRHVQPVPRRAAREPRSGPPARPAGAPPAHRHR